MRTLRWTVLAALALAGTAAAQTPSGRSGVSSGDTYSNMNAYRELRLFGICIVRTQRSAALAISVAYTVVFALHVQMFANETGGYSSVIPRPRETARLLSEMALTLLGERRRMPAGEQANRMRNAIRQIFMGFSTIAILSLRSQL